MLVLRLELWSARTNKRTELGRCYIALRDWTEDRKRGDYDVVVNKRGVMPVLQPMSPAGPKPWRQGEVKDYPRLSYNMWRLVIRALRSTFPEEK